MVLSFLRCIPLVTHCWCKQKRRQQMWECSVVQCFGSLRADASVVLPGVPANGDCDVGEEKVNTFHCWLMWSLRYGAGCTSRLQCEHLRPSPLATAHRGGSGSGMGGLVLWKVLGAWLGQGCALKPSVPHLPTALPGAGMPAAGKDPKPHCRCTQLFFRSPPCSQKEIEMWGFDSFLKQTLWCHNLCPINFRALMAPKSHQWVEQES